MELDELKKDWESISSKSDRQKRLTAEEIDQMTRKKYQSKIQNIKHPEIIGGIVCFMGLLFISLNFSKLDTSLFQMIGILTGLLLFLLPLFSYFSLKGLNRFYNVDKPYVETIRQFAKDTLRFKQYQRVNAILNYLLLVVTSILLPKFFYEKDMTAGHPFWLFALPLGYIFLIFFSRWVKKFYSKSLKQAEELLKETASGRTWDND